MGSAFLPQCSIGGRSVRWSDGVNEHRAARYTSLTISRASFFRRPVICGIDCWRYAQFRGSRTVEQLNRHPRLDRPPARRHSTVLRLGWPKLFRKSTLTTSGCRHNGSAKVPAGRLPKGFAQSARVRLMHRAICSAPATVVVGAEKYGCGLCLNALVWNWADTCGCSE